jgi:hypothetical protein
MSNCVLRAATVGTLCFLTACGDNQAGAAREPAPQPTLTLEADAPDSAGRITHELTFSGAAGFAVGSFRVAVHYDSARVKFLGAQYPDTVIIATNDVGGRVLIAGAAATGFKAGPWLSLNFAPRAAGAVARPPQIEVMDLADLTGKDLRDRVGVPQAYKPAK